MLLMWHCCRSALKVAEMEIIPDVTMAHVQLFGNSGNVTLIFILPPSDLQEEVMCLVPL